METMKWSKLIHQLFRALPISLTPLSASCCAGNEARSAPPTSCRVNIAWDRDSEQGVAERVSWEDVNSQDQLQTSGPFSEMKTPQKPADVSQFEFIAAKTK